MAQVFIDLRSLSRKGGGTSYFIGSPGISLWVQPNQKTSYSLAQPFKSHEFHYAMCYSYFVPASPLTLICASMSFPSLLHNLWKFLLPYKNHWIFFLPYKSTGSFSLLYNWSILLWLSILFYWFLLSCPQKDENALAILTSLEMLYHLLFPS